MFQRLPQIDILYRLLVGGSPVAQLPLRHPFEDAFAHVLRVGVQHHVAVALQRRERLDRRGQLHAIVGGERFAALELFLVLARAQDRAPSARPGVAAAGTVGVDLDCSHLLILAVNHMRFALRGVVGSMRPPTTLGRNRQRGRIGVSVYTRLRALIR